MKIKTLIFVKTALVAAGILLFCIPAVLSLEAYTYKTFIPLSVITVSCGVIVPELLCIGAKRNKRLQEKRLFFVVSRFSPYIYVSSCLSHRHRYRHRRHPLHSTCCPWSV